MYEKRLREGRNRPRLVDATGTRRRLQALAAMGWPSGELAAHLGHSRDGCSIRRLQRDGGPISIQTAQAIQDLYDQLSMTPGPSAITRTRAQQSGWVPPLAWDDEELDNPNTRPDIGIEAPASDTDCDEVAISRACGGQLDPEQLSEPERHEVLQRLEAAGHSAQEIADRLHISYRTVQRTRSRNRQQAETSTAYLRVHAALEQLAPGQRDLGEQLTYAIRTPTSKELTHEQ